MTERHVMHATTVVEQRFDATPATVFDAWADVEKRRQWDLPGSDDWELTELEQDFRVGGRESSRFGPKGKAVHWSAGTFLDIVPGARIVSAGTMHEGTVPSSSTLCTVEFLADGSGTKLVLTDQSAFYDQRETPKDRRTGWGEILQRLARYMRSN